MSPRLSLLMEKVKAAPSLNSARPQRWVPLYDHYVTLREKGYTRDQAIDFLEEIEAIPAGDGRKALKAFEAITTNRNKKSANRS